MPVKRKKFFYGWVVVAGAWISTFVCSMALGTFGVFLPELIKPISEGGLGQTKSMLSGAYSLNMIVVAIFALAAGMLVDRLGLRRVMLIGGAVAVAGFVLLSLTTHIWQFYLFYGIVAPAGIAFAHMVPSISTVRRWFMRHAALAVGIAMTGSGLGVVIFALVMGALVGDIGWQDSYLVMGAIIFTGVTAGAFLMKKDPESVGTYPDGRRPTEEEIVSRPDYVARDVTWSIKHALKTRTWWLFVCAQFYYVAVLGFIGHIKAWGMEEVMVSDWTATSMISILVGAAAASRLIAGALSDWTMRRYNVTRKPAMYVCLFLITIGCIVAMPTGADNTAGLTSVAVLVGLGYGIGMAMFPTYLGDLFGVKSVPKLFGVMYVFTAGIFGALGPSLYGLISDGLGSYNVAFLITAVLCVISSISLYLIKPPVRLVEKAISAVPAFP
ncbi:MAG: MFS transporter [Chloroflexota bacterium]|nr:MFS transporter [Chloroflexota bacterium]